MIRNRNTADYVFISYKRENSRFAGAVRQALRAEQIYVWWDEQLQTGEQWEERIDQALVEARAIIVLWSTKSVVSDWVRHEASIGKIREALTHARIDDCEIPPPFRSIQAANLSNWNGQENDPEFRKLVQAITSIRKRRKGSSRKAMISYIASLILSLSIGFSCAWVLKGNPQRVFSTSDGTKPIVGQDIVVSQFGDAENTKRLEKFVGWDGTSFKNQANLEALQQWMKREGITQSVVFLLHAKLFAEVRARAVKDLL